MPVTATVRVAAAADVHYAKTSPERLQSLLSALSDTIDVLLLCGDLTHHGLVEEAAVVAKELGSLRMPILAVLGNHDHHSGQQLEIQRLLTEAGIHVMDGDSTEVRGIGFAGVKGFAGGFGRRMLEPWGEQVIQQFVHESVNEALKLESALARLATPRRIALLHYAPVTDTVEGEPPEIFPFLGSSRLEDPLNRFRVTAAFHGHAHHGRAEGRTTAGVPVYNVSMPLLKSVAPDGPPFRLLELPVEEAERA